MQLPCSAMLQLSDIHAWLYAGRDVVGLGEGVSRLELGTRVALEPGIPCWGSTVSRWATSAQLPLQLSVSIMGSIPSV